MEPTAPDTFWIIYLSSVQVTVALFRQNRVEKALKTVSFDLNQKNLFHQAVDQALAECAQELELEENQEPNEAAFIISPFWLDQASHLLPDKYNLINHLCHSLKFKALGFVASDEGLSEVLTRQEGLPPSFILAFVGQAEFHLSLCYLGKIKTRTRLDISAPLIAETVFEAVSSLQSSSALPPQIIVWGSHSQQLIQDLKNYPWINSSATSPNFLHFPEINEYDFNSFFKLLSTVITRQTTNSSDQEELTSTTTLPVLKDSDQENLLPVPEETISSHEIPPSLLSVSAETFGFTSPDQSAPPSPSSSSSPPVSFSPPPSPSFSSEFSTSPFSAPPPSPPQKAKPSSPFSSSQSLLKALFVPFSFSQKFFISTFSLLRKIPLPRRLPLIFLPLFAVFFLLPLLVWIFLSKATFTLYLKPEKLTKTISTTLNPSATVFDPTQNQIPLIEQQTTVKEEASLPATGEAVIGDSAQGEVIIFNRTDEVKKFPQNTILNGPNQTSFQITSEVQVASSTPDLATGIERWGETKVTVKATKIGPSSNLAADTELSFEKFPSSQFLAKTVSALSGGTSQTVKAVSSADHQKLKSLLEEQIKASLAKQDSPSSSSDRLLDTLSSVSFDKIDFNREIGEKAEELQASAEAQIISYSLSPSVENELISHYLLSDLGSTENTQIKDFKLLLGDSSATAPFKTELTLEASLLKLPDMEALAQKLKRRRLSGLDSLLLSLPQVYRFQSKLSPPFPSPFDFLPPRSSRITIEIDNPQ